MQVTFSLQRARYGDPEVNPQSEAYRGRVDPYGPRSCYDESKRYGESIVRAYRDKHNIDVRVARIFNTYGPKMRIDDCRVIPPFVRQALNVNDLTVYGEGEQTRVFVTSRISSLDFAISSSSTFKRLSTSGIQMNGRSTNWQS
jgi:nucleoside-diphosphate-sugar epimerase